MRKLICLLLFALSSQHANAATTVIFVDGIDFNQTFMSLPDGLRGFIIPNATNATPYSRALIGPAPDRAASYLKDSWLGTALVKELGASATSVPWNGDLNDTANLNKAITDLQSALMSAARRGDSVVLVTHSMGTVVGYVALNRLADQTDPQESHYKGVDYFITLASPLSSERLLRMLNRVGTGTTLGIPAALPDIKIPSALRIRHGWINIYTRGDVIGATQIPARGVSNYETPGCPISPSTGPIANICAHSVPYMHYDMIRMLVNEIAATSKSTQDLNGTWIATGYQCFDLPSVPEIVSISQSPGMLVATKTEGDACIPSGEVTFFGSYVGDLFPDGGLVAVRVADAARSTNRVLVQGQIQRVSAMEFTVNVSGTVMRFQRQKPALSYTRPTSD